jgi:hypothetical protein
MEQECNCRTLVCRFVAIICSISCIFLVFACSDKSRLSETATDGYYLDGVAVKTVSLYGHCKSEAEKVKGKGRFVPIWKEENIGTTAEGECQVDIVFERAASNHLDEAIAGSDAAVLTVYELDDSLNVTGSAQIWGKLKPVGDGRTSARFKLKFEKGRYALENPYDFS